MFTPGSLQNIINIDLGNKCIVAVFLNVEEKKVTAAEVRAKFVDLAETHFVQRCPEVSSVKKSGNKSIPLFTLEEQNLYRVPDVEVDGTSLIQVL